MSVIIIVLIIICFFIYLHGTICDTSFITKSGRKYKASDMKTAEILDVLRDISIDLIYSDNISKQDSVLLRKTLQNTSFIELINLEDRLMAWNYDKGRELGFKIYNNNGSPISADEIINSLLHELAHSLVHSYGHGKEWENKNNEFQSKFRTKYVKILLNKTFLTV